MLLPGIGRIALALLVLVGPASCIVHAGGMLSRTDAVRLGN